MAARPDLAQIALDAYQKASGSEGEDIVVDLLADLLHLVGEVELFELLDTAHMHWSAEFHHTDEL